MSPDTARIPSAQNRQPSFDRWLRFDPHTATLYEDENRGERVAHLRKAIFFGILIYNLYIVSNALLMPDFVRESLFVRLFLGTPTALAIAWIIARLSSDVRENLLVAGLLCAHALPLALFWQTQSELGAYTFGEIALTVVYGNMLLALRFPQAVVFTASAMLMTFLIVATKPQLPIELQLAFVLQFSVASIFSLYANYIMEHRRCNDYTHALSSVLRAEQAEQSTAVHRVMSKTDALTNLPNRRHLDEHLDNLFKSDHSVAILMIDIDHFKLFNDSLGHPAGDDCLQQLADIFRTFSERQGVFCARFGGEEFSMVMSDATEQDAAQLAQDTVSGVAALAVIHPGRDDGINIVTASVGVAIRPIGATHVPKDVLLQADQALYHAKSMGRNRFAIADHAALDTSVIAG